MSKLSPAVGAVIEGQTPNTVELANLLPLETERRDMREQGLRRLLKNPLPDCEAVMEPVARQERQEAARNGQRVLLSLDRTGSGGSDGGVDGMLAGRGPLAAVGVDHRAARSALSRFKRGLRRLKRCLQNDLLLPVFWAVMRN